MSPEDRERILAVLLEEGAIREEIFAAIVADFVDYWRSGDRMIAAEFEVAATTVQRWARGSAVPHPRIRQAVVDWIWEQLE